MIPSLIFSSSTESPFRWVEILKQRHLRFQLAHPVKSQSQSSRVIQTCRRRITLLADGLPQPPLLGAVLRRDGGRDLDDLCRGRAPSDSLRFLRGPVALAPGRARRRKVRVAVFFYVVPGAEVPYHGRCDLKDDHKRFSKSGRHFKIFFATYVFLNTNKFGTVKFG